MKLYTNFSDFINEDLQIRQKDTAKIAKKFASAISKADGKKFTITKNSLDAGGWDLDMDGEEFAGGTYFIGDNGEIVNAATNNEVYGHIDDSEAELVKKIKKGKFTEYYAIESASIIEAKKYTVSQVITAWKDAFGEDMRDTDRADIPDDIEADYRGKVTVKDLEEIYDDRYGEEIEPEFLEALGESVVTEPINEALKSSKLRNLINIKHGGKELMKGIYGLAKVALDKVTDDMIITNTDPVQVYKKAKTYGNVLIFWISRNQKRNPYAPNDRYGYSSATDIPANTLLAVSNDKNEMFDNHISWTRAYSDGKERSKNTRSLRNKGRYPGSKDTVGVDKSHRTYSGTGLGNIKRIAEVSDECYIINLDAVRDSLSTSDKVSQRASQKADATAFDNPKDIKQANIAKYQSILAKRADKPEEIDKKVKEVIEDAHKFLIDGLSKKEMGEYGDLKIGEDPRGRAISPRDISNYISNLLSDYQGYVNSYVSAKTEAERYGSASDYYKRDAKRRALEVKNRIDKWKNKNIVW